MSAGPSAARPAAAGRPSERPPAIRDADRSGRTGAPSRRRPTAAKRLAVLAASTLLVLGLAEVGLRLAGYDPVARIAAGNRFMIRQSESPELVYEFAPGTSGTLWDTAITINAGGFRDREFPLQKPPGTLRVIALGDSVTFGPGLEVGERWTDQLAAKWDERGLDAEVLNMGVPGYDLAQEVAYLAHRGLAYDPDEVIVCFCINDLQTISFDYETVATLRRLQSGPFGWSRVAQWITLTLDRVRQVKSQGAIRDAERIASASAEITPDPELERLTAALVAATERAGVAEEYKDRTYRSRLLLFAEPGRQQLVRDSCERLAGLAREHGIGVTFFVAPVLYEGLDSEGWSIAYDIIRHITESSGFRFVDVYPQLSATPFAAFHVKKNDYVHLNALAHREMARALAQGTRHWFE